MVTFTISLICHLLVGYVCSMFVWFEIKWFIECFFNTNITTPFCSEKGRLEVPYTPRAIEESSAMDLPSSDLNSNQTERGPGEADGGEITDADIDIDLQDVKKECMEYSKRINQTDGKKESSPNSNGF